MHVQSHVKSPAGSGTEAMTADGCEGGYDQAATDLVKRLARSLVQHGKTITTAESCTGGLLAAALTEIPGSSGWFQMGTIAYSNEAKNQNLNVPVDVFRTDGAVSATCVRAMAQGALDRSGADIAVSVSGIAGPDGGTAEKPVGTVWIAWAMRTQHVSQETQTINKPSGLPLNHRKGSVPGAGSAPDPQQNLSQTIAPDIEAAEYRFSGDRQRVREQAVLSALRGTIRRIC